MGFRTICEKCFSVLDANANCPHCGHKPSYKFLFKIDNGKLHVKLSWDSQEWVFPTESIRKTKAYRDWLALYSFLKQNPKPEQVLWFFHNYQDQRSRYGTDTLSFASMKALILLLSEQNREEVVE